ncbi:MAG: phosphoribosyltransferase family protein, partial [Chloroflexota bacterium]
MLDTTTVQGMRISADAIAAVEASERRELHRRERLYRGTRPLPDLAGKTVVVVDDGLPPGASMRAAVEATRQLGPRRIVAAVRSDRAPWRRRCKRWLTPSSAPRCPSRSTR